MIPRDVIKARLRVLLFADWMIGPQALRFLPLDDSRHRRPDLPGLAQRPR